MTTLFSDMIRDAQEDTELNIYCQCATPLPTGCVTPDGEVCDCGGLIVNMDTDGAGK